MCTHISPAAAQPRAVSLHGRAASVHGVVPRGCRLKAGDLLDLVRIEPSKTVGEPRWNGWTAGSACETVRLTLYSEDLDAIREAGYELPPRVSSELAVNIPFYMGAEQDRFMWRIAEVVRVAFPAEIVLDCPLKLIAAGDVILQESWSQTEGTHRTRLAVLEASGKDANRYGLRIKNQATGEEKQVYWASSTVMVCGGPKIAAYRENPALCSKGIGRPVWVGENARV